MSPTDNRATDRAGTPRISVLHVEDDRLFADLRRDFLEETEGMTVSRSRTPAPP